MLRKVKKCPQCGKKKSRRRFAKHRSTKDGLGSYCLECHVANKRAWIAANPKKARLSWRKTLLKTKYKMTLEDYAEMFRRQKGRCAICSRRGGGISSAYPLDVDHCHKTNKRRGLLCGNCNRGLGQFKDGLKIIEAAVVYLRRFL